MNDSPEVITEEIIIVYYIYINPSKNWKAIIGGQINDLLNVELLNYSKLFCVICTPSTELFEDCKELINSMNKTNSTNFSHVLINNFDINKKNIFQLHIQKNTSNTYILH